MSRPRYTEEFKIEAVKQVVERGHRVAEVAERLGVSGHSLYHWIKRYDKPVEQRRHPLTKLPKLALARASKPVAQNCAAS